MKTAAMWWRYVDKRRDIKLHDMDAIASGEILGWLAFPRRPDHGFRTIQQWAMRRQLARGEISELPAWFDKPSRLQKRIYTLDRQLRRRLRAGDWLAQRMGKESGSPFHSRGLNALARRENHLLQFQFAERSDVDRDTPNLIRDYWTQSLPVIHLAKSSLMAILEAFRREERNGWHLERMIFWSDWVPEAIHNSESAALWASRLGLVPERTMIRFFRE